MLITDQDREQTLNRAAKEIVADMADGRNLAEDVRIAAEQAVKSVMGQFGKNACDTPDSVTDATMKAGIRTAKRFAREHGL